MRVVWDVGKASANLRKHHIDFADAATSLDDPFAATIEDERFDEPRFLTIGRDRAGRLITTAFAYLEDPERIRIISAREATPHERRHYDDGLKD